jgi:hypothetical protein
MTSLTCCDAHLLSIRAPSTRCGLARLSKMASSKSTTRINKQTIFVKDHSYSQSSTYIHSLTHSLTHSCTCVHVHVRSRIPIANKRNTTQNTKKIHSQSLSLIESQTQSLTRAQTRKQINTIEGKPVCSSFWANPVANWSHHERNALSFSESDSPVCLSIT